MTTQIDTRELAVLEQLGNEITSLQKTLPYNSKGLPTAYIDAQTVLEKRINSDKPKRVNNASIKLDYLEGYPVVNGLPFWERLDGEKIDYYKMFKYYRDSKDIKGMRTFKDTSENFDVKAEFISAVAKVYLWRLRTKAYDLYNEQLTKLKKKKKVEEMESRHSSAAKQLFQLASDKIKSILEDKHEGIKIITSVKDLKDIVELATKLERVSRGLPGDKPLSEEDKNDFNTIIGNLSLTQDNSKTQNNVNTDKKDLQEVMDLLVSCDYIKVKDKEIEVLEDDNEQADS